MSILNRTSSDLFKKSFYPIRQKQTNGVIWYMHWRGLCTLPIPTGRRTDVCHDVRRHPFDRPTLLCLTLPQQPLLG
jgi:hypothetical protein